MLCVENTYSQNWVLILLRRHRIGPSIVPTSSAPPDPNARLTLAQHLAILVVEAERDGASHGSRGGSGDGVVAGRVRRRGVAGAGHDGDQVPVRGDPVQRRGHRRLLHPLRGATRPPQGLCQGSKSWINDGLKRLLIYAGKNETHKLFLFFCVKKFPFS
jgi:hypothetical protein